MKRPLANLAMLFLVSLSPTSHAEIVVAPDYIRVLPPQPKTVNARSLEFFDLGNLKEGDAIAVEVHVLNDVYKDLSAYIVDAVNVSLARQNMPFRPLEGATKKMAPFKFMAEISVPGPHYLLLDNRFAQVINKKVIFQLAFKGRFSGEQIAAKKATFEGIYKELQSSFKFTDFNIIVKSCGVSNAFSTTATGDVTICNEILEEMSSRPGAMTAVVLHELGHTLLNIWGYPNYGNEDDADQFAAIMLLRSGEKGNQALYEWMQWYAEQDTRAQIANMVTVGDTHALSVQRIRNIQSAIQNSTDLIKRWNTVLYPKMTDAALKEIVMNPAAFDNLDAAKKELDKR